VASERTVGEALLLLLHNPRLLLLLPSLRRSAAQVGVFVFDFCFTSFVFILLLCLLADDADDVIFFPSQAHARLVSSVVRVAAASRRRGSA
jgi:hypothetical protein